MIEVAAEDPEAAFAVCTAQQELRLPSDQMNQLGIVQAGAAILTTPARRFDLPTERTEAEETTARLLEVLRRLTEVHEFAKGRGLAAPQIGLDRAAAAVQPPNPDDDVLILLNPRVVDAAGEQDEQYEGCLSFFDVRGLVPRPLRITVETTAFDGTVTTTTYENGLARLVHHEVDHLDGLLYTARMRDGVDPFPVEQYRQTGRRWPTRASSRRPAEGVMPSRRCLSADAERMSR